LVELISGEKPIQADSVEKIFDQILHQPLNLEPARAKGAPKPVLDLIARCTAKNPAERPQTFAIVRQQIEQIQGAAQPPTIGSGQFTQQSAVLTTPPSKLSQTWIIVFSAGGVVALVLILFLLGRIFGLV
jgi:serine/threonine protein kinase